MKHEDNRRIIYDWAQGDFKSLKTVYVKEPIPIGNHYHKNKDEYFMLVTGKFLELQLNEETLYNIDAPHIVVVKRNTYHKFICEPGSVFVCGATELFNHEDEIK